MRFLLLNQFVPPDASPTARLLGEVAAELEDRGHFVEMVGNRDDYRGKKTLLGSRALREAAALGGLLVRGCLRRRCHVIVCLTSPPLLLVIGRLLVIRHRGSRLIHWAMDLYPDVAVALGEVERDSRIHRTTRRLMRRAYYACDLIIALDEDMADRIGAKKVRKEIVPPWPPKLAKAEAEHRPGKRKTTEVESDATFVWLYSGNLGRAHEWRTLLKAQEILETDGGRIELIFQGGGTEIEASKHFAEELGLKRARWQDYAPDHTLVESLQSADCLVATQRPETQGYLWPSKLALASLLDRPILWVGPENGSVWNWLESEGHGCFRSGDAEAVAEFLRDMMQRETPAPVTLERVSERVEDVRRDGIAAVTSYLCLPRVAERLDEPSGSMPIGSS